MNCFAIKRKEKGDYFNGEYPYPGLTKDSHYRFQPEFSPIPKLFGTVVEAEKKLEVIGKLFDCEIVKIDLTELGT